MLSTNAIQNLFGSVFSKIYEEGVLQIWATSTTRDPATGTFPMSLQASAPCRVQRDQCTEQQRQEEGYSPQDVRLLVLQAGLTITPNTDSRVVYRGRTHRVMSVDQDPARSYFDFRARLTP